MVIAVTLPLAGYRVLELAHLIAGPVCGMYLADMGADVVKVEQPAVGDAARTIYDPRLAGDSVVFLTVNRNKRSVALDLGTGEGRRVFARLAARADVVVEAYRGGVAERLEIDYARLAPLNPRLVYCSLSAFGPEGPWREKPGLDMLVQAMGGLMAVTGEPDGGPILCGAPVLDTLGAVSAALGVLTALLHRERTGEGQRVDVSLLGGALLAHAARLSVFLVTGQEPGRQGSAHPYLVPFQAFATADGWIYVAVWVERLWKPFCTAIERPELATDPRFAGRDDRLRHRRELVAALAPIFLTRTVQEWLARLERHEVLCAPVNRYADLPTDPQVVASRMLLAEDHPRAGRLTTLDTPIRFSRTPGGIRAHAPALGEHTDVVLSEAGLAPDELARLRETKVIA
ncbi:MAG: formyl-CoA transferase [Candidatus Rokuibacteriota bacterium]|nr:MAG: formyl-CoA transferase [Candidatus Rokubacteria bacterium]PYN70624.1 MAG: formyl-CoA transferase [Candidatus Rokubacteria bacterium]